MQSLEHLRQHNKAGYTEALLYLASAGATSDSHTCVVTAPPSISGSKKLILTAGIKQDLTT